MKPKGEKKFRKTIKLTNALSQAQKEISLHARSKYMAYPAFHDFSKMYPKLFSTNCHLL